MMKLLTPKQMKAIDEIAINQLGIPGIVLMENAATQVAAKASAMLKGKKEARITVIAGAGNNGGDAFAVARHLLSMGHAVSLFSMASAENLSGDALTNSAILKNLGMDIVLLSNEASLERLAKCCRDSDLVIEGLLGTGLNRDAEGLWASVIETVNDCSPSILSIDIASGVDGLTGKIRGHSIKAHATVTFFLPKVGMVQYPGAACMGEVTVADIGIPYALAESLETPELMEREDILRLLPERPSDAHKGTFGKVLMIAGSEGMSGAAYLSALSAYRMGTGLVKLAAPASLREVLPVLIPEAVFSWLPVKEGHACLDAETGAKVSGQELIRGLVKGADAVLIGPGLSCNEDTQNLLRTVIEVCEKPIVFDADALNLLAENRLLLENIRSEAIITPHPAEMARLAGVETSGVSVVQEDRIGMAKQFADEFGLTVVLKGAGTIIAANDGRVAVNSTGNEGMATAGSGDVLAGIITSLLGQGLAPYDAAVAGAYIHGLAGDLAARETGSASLMASDIAAGIPKAFKELGLTKGRG